MRSRTANWFETKIRYEKMMEKLPAEDGDRTLCR